MSSSLPPSMTIQPINISLIAPHAHFGGCWSGQMGQPITCTLDPEHCTDPINPFVTALNHTTLTSPSSHDMHCLAEDIHAGKCPSGPTGVETLGTCVVGGCVNNTQEVHTPDCNLVMDTINDVSTLYGGCVESISNQFKGCFWSADDCAHGTSYNEMWMVPDDIVELLSGEDSNSSYEKKYCDCSDVRIGACHDQTVDQLGNGLVCAVEAKQCGVNETFVSARTIVELPNVYGSLDCRLCPSTAVTSEMKSKTEAHLEAKASEKSGTDEDGGVKGGGDGDDVPTAGGGSSKKSDGPDGGAIAGGVIGGLVGLLALVWFAYCLCLCSSGSYDYPPASKEELQIKSGGTYDEDDDGNVYDEDRDDVPAVQAGEMS